MFLRRIHVAYQCMFFESISRLFRALQYYTRSTRTEQQTSLPLGGISGGDDPLLAGDSMDLDSGSLSGAIEPLESANALQGASPVEFSEYPDDLSLGIGEGLSFSLDDVSAVSISCSKSNAT